MKIRLTRTDILKALPKVAKGLGKYIYLQALIGAKTNLSRNEVFQKKYNGFYKVRRNAEWRSHYFKIMESKRHKKKGKGLEFLDVLKTIHRETGKVEASFASKLTATIDTSLPVIDSIVMKNLGLKLPGSGTPQRLSEMAKVYDEMTAYYKNYLRTEDGKYLVEQFEKQYPRAKISNVKMLDFVLWQTRQ